MLIYYSIFTTLNIKGLADQAGNLEELKILCLTGGSLGWILGQAVYILTVHVEDTCHAHCTLFVFCACSGGNTIFSSYVYWSFFCVKWHWTVLVLMFYGGNCFYLLLSIANLIATEFSFCLQESPRRRGAETRSSDLSECAKKGIAGWQLDKWLLLRVFLFLILSRHICCQSTYAKSLFFSSFLTCHC